jgi:hypothetical protein
VFEGSLKQLGKHRNYIDPHSCVICR